MAREDTEVDETEDDTTVATATDEDTTTTDVAEEPDWKQHSRKHEREAKKARQERDALAAKLREQEDADKSEHERALDAARTEAAQAARSEIEQERRHDRLEVAVTRAAARTFADTDDALLHLERAVNRGDVDPEDIFDSDGKVKTDALQSALDELLERKPHLAARTPGPGENDAGKGGGGGKDLEAMSVEDHLKEISRSK